LVETGAFLFSCLTEFSLSAIFSARFTSAASQDERRFHISYLTPQAALNSWFDLTALCI